MQAVRYHNHLSACIRVQIHHLVDIPNHDLNPLGLNKQATAIILTHGFNQVTEPISPGFKSFSIRGSSLSNGFILTSITAWKPVRVCTARAGNFLLITSQFINLLTVDLNQVKTHHCYISNLTKFIGLLSSRNLMHRNKS